MKTYLYLMLLFFSSMLMGEDFLYPVSGSSLASESSISAEALIDSVIPGRFNCRIVMPPLSIAEKGARVLLLCDDLTKVQQLLLVSKDGKWEVLDSTTVSVPESMGLMIASIFKYHLLKTRYPENLTMIFTTTEIWTCRLYGGRAFPGGGIEYELEGCAAFDLPPKLGAVELFIIELVGGTDSGKVNKMLTEYMAKHAIPLADKKDFIKSKVDKKILKGAPTAAEKKELFGIPD